MRREYLEIFAVFFSFLVLLQDAHALVRRNTHREFDDDFNKVTDTQIRKKRGLGLFLVVFGAGSAGLDIYKQEAGCKHITPDLQPTIDLAKDTHEHVITIKDQVNLAWVPVESKERNAERLASDMTIIREQITFFDALQTDIITLLDNKIITKMNQFRRELENQIENNNVTDVVDFETLEAKFHTPLGYGFSLTIKLAPLGVYLGTRYLLPKITKRFASKQAEELVKEKPNLRTKMIDAYTNRKAQLNEIKDEKITSFKKKMNARWDSFELKHPKAAGALRKIRTNKVTKKIGKFVKNHKAKIIKAGNGVAVGFTIGYEIYDFVKFIQDCQEKLSNAEEGLAILEESRKNLTLIMGEIQDLRKETDEYYGYMKSNITSDGYLNFVRDIISLGRNSENQTTELTEATNDIQNYVDQIREADDDKTDKLNKMVITAFGNINFKLDCLRSKLAIVAGVRDGCANGVANFDKLFEDAKSREKNIVDTCIDQHFMTKSGLQETTSEAMKLENLQPICIRNNPTKKALACTNYYDNMPDEENMRRVGDVTIEDIEFFISSCPPAPITEVTKIGICQKKEENAVLSEVLGFYKKHNQTAVQSIYDNCELSDLQKESVCNMKRNGLSLANVQTKFSLYSLAIVEKVFNSCTKLDTVDKNTFDHSTICNLRSNGIFPDDPKLGFLYDSLKAKYTDAAIENVVCP